METPSYLLIEHAAGYGLFLLKEFEEIGQILAEVEASHANLAKFSSLVSSVAFHWFTNAEAALENCNALSEGILHSDLLNFLESNVPKKKKKKSVLGISDPKLAGAIGEAIPHIQCTHGGVVPEVMRGLRTHFQSLADMKSLAFSKAQLGLGHSYSRAKVKFDVNRVDNMIIQSIALSDQLDKDINTFGMRIREWYSYHFPELYKIVPDQHLYARSVMVVGDRKQMDEEEVTTKLQEILEDEEKVKEIIEASRSSMGMDISPIDLMNVQKFAVRVVSLAEYRRNLQGYLKDKMSSCAPNLSTLIGDQVGARLISHAGSLTNLAKYPASTVQILGAEKALFRALKTRGNTPKYGLLFHSTYIGRAGVKNKGRISRYLANKCSLASRIDCFSEVVVNSFGELLKQQVEDRLKYFDTGDVPKKNLEVMREAVALTPSLQAKELKRRKKAAKKAKKKAAVNGEADESNVNGETEPDDTPAKKKRKKSVGEENEPMDTTQENGGDTETPSKKKKKKKKAKQVDTE